MIAYYTAVDADHDVTIYRSAVAVARFLSDEGAMNLAPDETAPASENQILRKLRASDLMLAYEANASEWKYKVKKHIRVKG